MSHQPERTLKDCLNCGTLVHGRFCHACGQENIVPHQNFWSLTRHFIFDIFHFDGKFFDTLRLLLFRPGRIPQEYCAGRRQKYLDPIRMYLFTSAIFFLIFFATGRESAIGGIQNKSDRYLTSGERWRLLSVTPADSMDATTAARLRMLKDTTSAMVLTRDDAADRSDPATIQLADGIYRMTPEKFRTDIDTGRQDSWLERQVSKKLTENKRKSADDLNRFSDDLSNRFLHQLPYMLFVSLPLFALWLKLLYMRRKKFVYSDHA
ncbi:MAG TPA: DUF3667 domain-containing protein, partial [Flavisolibacter sp.]